MKKLISFVCFATICTLTFAQGVHIVEDFETNSLGWTETSSNEGEAVIKDGALHLSGKTRDGFDIFGNKRPAAAIISSCYAGFDPSKNFEIKMNITAKTVNEKDLFGIILNYMDDYNYVALLINEKKAVLLRYINGDLVGYKASDLKAASKRKAEYNISIKSTYQDLKFYNNDVMVLNVKYLPIEYSGIGLYASGLQTIDVDQVEIIQ